MKATSCHIGALATSQLCFNTGLILLATTADEVRVAEAVDNQLGDRQNPNLVHAIANTMTAFALTLTLGAAQAM